MCLVHDVRGQTVTKNNSQSRWSGLRQPRAAMGPALSTRKQREGTLPLLLPSALAMDRKKADLSLPLRVEDKHLPLSTACADSQRLLIVGDNVKRLIGSKKNLKKF